MIKVAIVQRRLAHYRLPLYKRIIANHPDIALNLYCGLPESSSGGSGIPLGEQEPSYVKRVKTYSLPFSKKALLLQPGVIGCLVFGHYDVLVCEGTPKLITTILILAWRRLIGAKSVLWLKGWPTADRDGKAKRWLRTLFLGLADAYIVYGQESKKQLLSYGIASDQITIAQNTVETQHLLDQKNGGNGAIINHPAVQKIFENAHPYIFNIGRHIHEKRVEDLINAFSVLLSDGKYKNFELVLAGSGPDTNTLKKIAEKLHLKNVHFVGAVPDHVADALFMRSRCCVFPGAVGLALNQAMACGKPVICADEPGADSELLIHQFNGLRYQRGNIPELVDCLKVVLRDPELQKALGAEGRETIRKTATIENMAKQYVVALRASVAASRNSMDSAITRLVYLMCKAINRYNIVKSHICTDPSLTEDERGEKYFWYEVRKSPEFDKRFALDLSGKTVLEIGTGFGGYTYHALRAGARHVYGVDIDPHRVQKNRELLRSVNASANYTIHECGAENMPQVLPESVDIVVSDATLEHITRRDELLAEIKRVLRTGGNAYLSTSPIWLTWNGGHLARYIPFPWGHLLMPERLILDILRMQRRNGDFPASALDNIIGIYRTIGRLTIAKLKNEINASGLQLVAFQNRNPRRIKRVLSKVPVLEEFFAGDICVHLRKPEH